MMGVGLEQVQFSRSVNYLGATVYLELTENNATIYEIKLQGYLENKWSEWFYGMTITHERDNTTTLYGPLPDQTVLHSVMDRIRDMNLPLVSVNLIEPDGQPVKDEADGVSTDIP